MNSGADLIARKYAQAFLRVAGKTFSQEEFKKSCVLSQLLKRERMRLFFLRSPVALEKDKLDFLRQLLAPFECRPIFEKLCSLLALHRRLFLLPDVIAQACNLYAHGHEIERFFIASSHSLSIEECRVITGYLAQETGRTIFYEQVQAPRLIAGVRAYSDAFLWEYSINKQLAQIARCAREK